MKLPAGSKFFMAVMLVAVWAGVARGADQLKVAGGVLEGAGRQGSGGGRYADD